MTAKPPFEPQQQDFPGHEAAMQPRPDHGEETYRGSGRLAGKRALVTGGDSGIGRAVAIAFAREGADVAVSYLDEEDDAAEVRHWVEKAGRKCILIDGDIAAADHCRDVVSRTVDGLGGLDILVNNAAYQKPKVSTTSTSKIGSEPFRSTSMGCSISLSSPFRT